MQGFDVGGSHKSQQSAYEVFGVQNQARVVTEGMDHTEGVGGTGFYEDYFANEEVLGQRARQRRRDELGRARRSWRSSKSGGNTFSGLVAPQLPAGQLRRQQRRQSTTRAATAPAECLAPQCANPNLLFWEGHADLGGPIVARQGLVLSAPTTTSRSTRSCRASPRKSPPTSASSTTTRSKAPGSRAEQHAHRLPPARAQAEAAARAVRRSRPPESIQAQDSWSTMYKGEWQWVDVAAAPSSTSTSAASRSTGRWCRRSIRPSGRRSSFRRRRPSRGAGWNSLHDRPEQAAGEGAADLLHAAEERRQPRLQVRLRRSSTIGTASASMAATARYRLLVSVVCERPARPHSLRRHRRRTSDYESDWTVGAEHRPPP